MRVAINCRSFLNKMYTGIGRYTYHLIKSLGEIDQETAYLLYAKKGIFNMNKHLPKFRRPNLYLKIDRLNKGMDATLGKVDVYHSPSPDALDVNSGAKIVVTVHDLIFKTFPEGHTQKTIDDTEKQFQHIVEKAAKIICCSQNTLRDLQRFFSVAPDKVKVVYQGVDKDVFYKIRGQEERQARHYIKAKGIRDPYILSVGTIEPRKNLENILHAFDKLRTRKKFQGKLVVIGMRGWMSEGIGVLIRKLELKEHVRFLGYLPDRELRWFYNNAAVFLFPSFYEGFGFPIVEAFCCGVPVVTSHVSSCPEVANGAAIIRDPYDPEDIAEGIAEVVNEPLLRQTLIRRGFARAEDFSLLQTARETLRVYQEAYQSLLMKQNQPTSEHNEYLRDSSPIHT